MLIVGNPVQALEFSALPNAGVGLARLEFIINNTIGIHPRALLDYDKLPEDIRKRDCTAHHRLCKPARLLRRSTRRGRGHHRRGLLSASR